ncbi:hypothetical protein L1987_21062 [Smallanthus sonchifolius]|uniref:Uncharacterized protein n=1 Tax=Smallanthus sonchifolius TaxID=185202 RepID=A0ACB9IU37_9ASTR|nr:hypothetical protein L1987_21062 [Smallanthus sonchifolius]
MEAAVLAYNSDGGMGVNNRESVEKEGRGDQQWLGSVAASRWGCVWWLKTRREKKRGGISMGDQRGEEGGGRLLWWCLTAVIGGSETCKRQPWWQPWWSGEGLAAAKAAMAARWWCVVATGEADESVLRRWLCFRRGGKGEPCRVADEVDDRDGGVRDGSYAGNGGIG